MSDKRAEKINDEIERQLEERGYVAIPDVLIGIGMLPASKYNEWKKGNLRCLEDTTRMQKALFPCDSR